MNLLISSDFQWNVLFFSCVLISSACHSYVHTKEIGILSIYLCENNTDTKTVLSHRQKNATSAFDYLRISVANFTSFCFRSKRQHSLSRKLSKLFTNLKCFWFSARFSFTREQQNIERKRKKNVRNHHPIKYMHQITIWFLILFFVFVFVFVAVAIAGAVIVINSIYVIYWQLHPPHTHMHAHIIMVQNGAHKSVATASNDRLIHENYRYYSSFDIFDIGIWIRLNRLIFLFFRKHIVTFF